MSQSWFPKGFSSKDSSVVGAKGTSDASAVLDIRSTTKGMLFPRMTTAQRTSIGTPATGLIVYDTNTLTVWQYDGSNWVEVGSGSGSGGINYIENHDAEAATTGWATYADAAGLSPVDGTGGSPNVTWTRSTSSPLRGLASFLLTKDAADRQGEGASYAFTIDSADQAKVMQIGFDYAVASGTYATGDVAIYIVDVTNGTVIQPSAYQVENVGVNSTARLTFQTASNSTSYRLCFHVASTSASAYSLKFDNITLGPQVVPMGAPVTDVASYVPVLTSSGGGAVTLNATSVAGPFGTYYRIGDTVYFQIDFRNGSAGAATGSAGTLRLALPPGCELDTSKQPITTAWGYRVGTGEFLTGATIYPEIAAVLDTSTNTISLFKNGTTSYISVSDITSSSGITLRGSYPVVGWSSSTVVSDSAASRKVTATILKTSGSVSGSSIVTNWSSASEDTHGMMNLSTGEMTIKVPGSYQFVFSGGVAAGDSTIFGPLINGSPLALWSTDGTSYFKNITVTLPNLKVGDIVCVRNGSSGSTTVTMFQWSMTLIQGPSQIAASEVIAMLCYKNTGSHTSSGNLQDVASWNTVTKDSHGGFNTTTGIYTVPAPGDYYVDIRLGWSSDVTGSRQVVILKGSTIVQYSPDISASASTGNHVSVLIPNCITGDTIKVQGFQSSGGNLSYNTTANLTTLSIHRLGGVM